MLNKTLLYVYLKSYMFQQWGAIVRESQEQRNIIPALWSSYYTARIQMHNFEILKYVNLLSIKLQCCGIITVS